MAQHEKSVQQQSHVAHIRHDTYGWMSRRWFCIFGKVDRRSRHHRTIYPKSGPLQFFFLFSKRDDTKRRHIQIKYCSKLKETNGMFSKRIVHVAIRYYFFRKKNAKRKHTKLRTKEVFDLFSGIIFLFLSLSLFFSFLLFYKERVFVSTITLFILLSGHSNSVVNYALC